MDNGFRNNYDNRLLGDGSEEEKYEEAVPEESGEEVSDEYYELPLAIRSRSLIWAVISFTLGILSLALCAFYYVSFALAACSVLSSLISRKNLGFFEKYSISGLILGIMGFVFSTFSCVASVLHIFG